MQCELIVTQWDVNNGVYTFEIESGKELIVTQWDVNYKTCTRDIYVGDELIVTQWDVNVTNMSTLTKEVQN